MPFGRTPNETHPSPDESLPVDESFAPWVPQKKGAPHPLDATEDERYVHQHELGRGGMGIVELVRDTRLARTVVRKRCRPDRVTQEASLRLAQEAWIAAQLDHPGVVTVLDAGRDQDGPWVVQEYMSGPTLRAALDAAPTPSARLAMVPWLADAAEAIGVAHAAGIVHRDLKPANLLSDRHGRTAVADWGLARPSRESKAAWSRSILPRDHTPQTVTGAVMGTPAYMSPEQAAGDEVDFTADVWSLGAMLYEVLTGAPPFGEGQPSELLRRLLLERPRDPREVEPSSPAALSALAMRAMAKSPADRPQDAAAFLTALRECQPHPAATPTPAPSRPTTVALSVGLALGLALVGVAGVGRLLTPEPVLSAALPVAAVEALVGRAYEGLDAGDLVTVDASLEALLSHAPGPDALGLCMARDGIQTPELVDTLPAPSCERLHLLDGGRTAICLDADGVRRLDLEEGVATWGRSGIGHSTRFTTQDGRHVIAQDGERLTVLFAEDGSRKDHWLLHPGNEPLALARDGEMAFCADRKVGWRGRDDEGLEDPIDLDAACPHIEAPLGELFYLPFQGGLIRGEDGRLDILPVQIPAEETQHIDYTPDGTHVAMVSWSGALWLNPHTPEAVTVDSVRGPARILALDPSGEILALARDRGGIEVRHASTGELLHALDVPDLLGLQFDGGDLLVHTEEEITRWRLQDQPRRRWLTNSGVASVRATHDGAHALVSLGSGDVELRTLPAGDLRWRRSISDSRVAKEADLSHDGETVLGLASLSDGLRGFTLADGLPTTALTFEPPQHARRLLALRDGWTVIAVNGAGPWVFDPSGKRRADLVQSGHMIVDMVPLGDRDGALLMGDHGELFRLTLEGDDAVVSSALHHADGRRIAVAKEGWPLFVASEVEITHYADAMSKRWVLTPGGPITDLALSPEGDLLAVAHGDGVTHVLDAETGAVRARLHGHAAQVASLDWSTDGAWLITSSWDSTLRLWSAAPLREGCEGA